VGGVRIAAYQNIPDILTAGLSLAGIPEIVAMRIAAV
jgi:hypothetical protein